ncbi:MAG: hypothetical protein IT542_00885 [Rubellimicrobium sp.]|nr:hypothetical protein [Rubellimicrobium sp.]
MWEHEITGATREIGDLLAARLGLRGGSAGKRLRRAGRLLPRALWPDARFLADAEAMAANPRLAHLVEPGRLDAATARLRAHLRGVDPRDRRRRRLVGILAVLAFDLLVLAVIGLAVWRWRMSGG